MGNMWIYVLFLCRNASFCEIECVLCRTRITSGHDPYDIFYFILTARQIIIVISL